MRKTVLIYSGGLDSTVLLYYLRKNEYDVSCLTVDYGQRHSREIESARTITTDLDLRHHVLDLSNIRALLGGSALTDDIAVPHGHYAEKSMKSTVVPNRNMILLSIGVGWALSLGASVVAYAAHSGDHAIYPDCRPEFLQELNHATRLCDWKVVDLLAPFLGLTKSEIVSLGHKLDVPFEKTWTCYEGGVLHCGRCGSCVERAEAFEIAEVKDPTRYEGVNQ